MESSPDLFNIRWNNYSAVLLSVFNRLLDGGQFVDVTLACEGQSIKCHRLVLSACSTYFEKLLTDNSYPHMVIYLKDMRFWQLQSLVTFMYTGEISINQDKLSQLVKAAESLKTSKCMLEDDESEDEESVQNSKSDTSIKTEETSEDRNEVSPTDSSASAPIGARKRKCFLALPRLLKMQRLDHIQQQPTSVCIPEVHIGAGSDDQVDEESINDSGDPDANGNMIDEDSQELYIHEATSLENMVIPNGSLRNRQTHKYDKEVRDTALAALGTGMSLCQCSEAFGIPRKTLSKWKSRSAAAATAVLDENSPECDESATKCQVASSSSSSLIDSSERAVRLQKAMELAISGVTVRQAAAQFDIPRTTLCAYMKRQGVAPKRNFLPSSSSAASTTTASGLTSATVQKLATASASTNSASQLQTFPPFLGLSEMMEELEQGAFVVAESQ